MVAAQPPEAPAKGRLGLLSETHCRQARLLAGTGSRSGDGLGRGSGRGLGIVIRSVSGVSRPTLHLPSDAASIPPCGAGLTAVRPSFSVQLAAAKESLRRLGIVTEHLHCRCTW